MHHFHVGQHLMLCAENSYRVGRMDNFGLLQNMPKHQSKSIEGFIYSQETLVPDPMFVKK